MMRQRAVCVYKRGISKHSTYMNEEKIILLSHGGGGLKTRQLLDNLVLPALGIQDNVEMDDAACLAAPCSRLAFTTDSYVVSPLFFPGGDIGRLAASGTINDLAMRGAAPFCLSVGLIIEEGLEMSVLERALKSLAAAAGEGGAAIVAGDTKVLERKTGDGLYINTTGIGIRRSGVEAGVANAKPGDAVLISGSLGDHGVAIMACRGNLAFSSELESDVAPLWPMISRLLDVAPGVHVMRDPTRGGVAAALCDIAEASGVGIRLREKYLPVKPQVRSACGLLGLDPIEVANEGKAIVVCAPGDAEPALEALRAHPLGRDAAVIGRVTEKHRGMVIMETAAGGERIIEPPLGENLPRIC